VSTIVLVLLSPTINAQLVADFTPDITGGCSPIVVNFSNTSTGTTNSTTYLWDFGNGNTSTLKNPGAIYSSEGVYTVTLTIRDGGLSSVKTKALNVYTSPVAAFAVSKNSGCLPLTVDFIAQSSPGIGSITTYYWDFGDGNTLQTAAPVVQHTYVTPLDASVSLTVTNSYGCTKTTKQEKAVKVKPQLSPVFTADKTILCSTGEKIIFRDTTAGASAYSHQWNFGDGNSSMALSPQHNYQNAGLYAVALTISSSDGCSATTFKDAYIRVATFSNAFNLPPLLCSNTPAVFTNNSSPAPTGSAWFINSLPAAATDSTSLSYTFNNAGTYTVKLLNTFGTCKDSVSKTITVKNKPLLKGFMTTISGNCGAPLKVVLADTTADAVAWQWDYNTLDNSGTDAVTQITETAFNNRGSINTGLTVANSTGCTASTVQPLKIWNPAVTVLADREPAQCGPYSIGFSIANSGEPITACQWFFGDGTTSTDPAPVHYFDKPGSYTVLLQYTTASGCTDTAFTDAFVMNEQPIAGFSTTDTLVCGNAPVRFNALPQNNVTYSWSYGDGTTATGGPDITYHYKRDGLFSIRLIVTTAAGCSDTITRSNYIHTLPPFTDITGLRLNCNNRGSVNLIQSTIKGNSWHWSFGDGDTILLNSNIALITHEYANSGIYKAILTVTNGPCIAKDSIRFGVLLKQNPLLQAAATTVCANGELPVTITNLELNTQARAGQNHYSFEKIEYDDGTVFTGSTGDSGKLPVTWSTKYDGSFTNFERDKTGLRVILKSTGYGCFDTTNFIPLDIKWSDAGYKTQTPTCFKTPTLFNDTSTTNSQILQHEWDFGDGAITNDITGNPIIHQYAHPGIYTVKQTVTDAYNCVFSSQQEILINGPKADFNMPLNSFVTLPVQMNNHSGTFNKVHTLFSWQFGEAGTSNAFAPSFSFTSPGEYTVTLIAADTSIGCRDTVIKPITINDFKASFQMSTSFLGPNNCLPVLAEFINTSVNYTSLKWTFGDNNSSENLTTPSNIYVKPGNYQIRLYAYGPEGLMDIYTDSILVKGPEAAMYADKQEACLNQEVKFTAVPGNSTIAFTWDYGDGTLTQNSDTITTHTYQAAGKITPYLIAYDSAGCRVSYSVDNSIIIRNDPVISFSPLPAIVCKGSTLSITANGGFTYTWLAAPGLLNTNAGIATVSPAANSIYTVQAADDIGCTSTGMIPVTVIDRLKINAVAGQAQCLGRPVTLIASGAATYQWIKNTEGLNSTAIANPLATPLQPGASTYTVVGTDAYGCFTDTANITVQALPLPNVLIKPVGEILFGSEIMLSPITTNNVTNWEWSPSKYLNCSNCTSPVSRPLEPMTYTLKVTDKNGCSNTASVQVNFICKESSVMIPSAFSPNNDGLNDLFMIRGIATVNWLQIYNRNGTVVFEKRNFNAGDNANGWDGYYKGNPADPGAYVYFAEIKCPNGNAFIKKGTLTLVR
jgi:gliding motility-associated-like protein